MQQQRKVISMEGMDLAELELQLKEFQPQFNKISERSKLTRADQFKKQALIKLEDIRAIEKKRGEHTKNISEYLSYLADLGFEYEKPMVDAPAIRTGTVEEPPRGDDDPGAADAQPGDTEGHF